MMKTVDDFLSTVPRSGIRKDEGTVKRDHDFRVGLGRNVAESTQLGPQDTVERKRIIGIDTMKIEVSF